MLHSISAERPALLGGGPRDHSSINPASSPAIGRARLACSVGLFRREDVAGTLRDNPLHTLTCTGAILPHFYRIEFLSVDGDDDSTRVGAICVRVANDLCTS